MAQKKANVNKASEIRVAFGCVAWLVAGLVAILLMGVLRGFVLSVLWSWFVVPVFGVAALNLPLAIGLAIGLASIVGMFTGSGTIQPENDKADASIASLIATTLFSMVGTPLLILGIGAIIRAIILAFV